MYAAARLLTVLRTVPEIVWALIFVFAVGLGPFPGVLALGFHTGGVLGKLFGEVLEDVDPPRWRPSRVAWDRRLILLYGDPAPGPAAVPPMRSTAGRSTSGPRPSWASWGPGGLGQRIHVAISLFHEHQLLTLILAIYVMVTLVDALSAFLRRRVV